MKTLASHSNKAELLRRLEGIRPDSERRWGTMSAHQMICHLTDACRMATGERQVSEASSVVQRTAVKWIALYLPLTWPQGILTRPEIDQTAGGGSCPGDFAADVAELERRLNALERDRLTIQWPPHPIFGRMSVFEWMRWAYLHTDHHLRQFGA